MSSSLQLTTVDGWTLATGGFEDDEPRIRDIELAERLGYERPRSIRDLIERLIRDEKLNDSDVRRTARRTQVGFAEKQVEEFWLTEAQALKVVAKSETSKADALLDEVIRVFVLARRGLLPAPAPHPPRLMGPEESVVYRSEAAVRIAMMASQYLDPYVIRRVAETAIERVGQFQLAPPENPTIDVEGYLSEKGLASDTIRRKRAQFGKRIAALYRKERGAEPPVTIRFINGADRRAKLYRETDRELFDIVFSDMFGNRKELGN